LLLSVHHIKNL